MTILPKHPNYHFYAHQQHDWRERNKISLQFLELSLENFAHNLDRRITRKRMSRMEGDSNVLFWIRYMRYLISHLLIQLIQEKTFEPPLLKKNSLSILLSHSPVILLF